MDGNGRWAKERGLSRIAGHREGMKRAREIIRAASDLGIKIITLFAFSAENWRRPKAEISMLMRSLSNFLGREIKELDKNNVKFLVIGRKEPLPGYLQKKIINAQIKTKDNTGLTLVLALNYGARQEIVDAVKKFAKAMVREEVGLEDLDEEKFSEYFYTAGLPDPDLLIRTSGEMRLSNFLLWQLSYAELHFPKKYWPDFQRIDLENAIRDYQIRERRFGRTNAS
jgi:undecaprenyl diphosphate synthase